jgi:GT2 family glycosyltransferase
VIRASVVVVVHSGVERLDDGLASLAAYAGRDDVEVVLVDNGSPDRCGEVARRRFPWVRVVRSEHNLGFAGGVHLGAELASGDVLMLVNDDAVVEPGWVEAHLDRLAASPEAAVSAGRLTSWDGSRHDFVRGAVTFDGHAFQPGQGWPVGEWSIPEPGEPMMLGCGGNMAIRRSDWDSAGGFDRELFAYLEDVELSWRLLAMGRHIVACPEAVARHRGGATSNTFGNVRRGVLFERNALRVFFACADDEHRAAFGTAVMTTFLHRLVAFAEVEPGLAALAADPFGSVPAVPSRGQRWRRRLAERGVVGSLRHLLARAAGGPEVGEPRLGDGLLLMQLRAAQGFCAGLERTTERRRQLEGLRRRTDRELLTAFPRILVPTYEGDARLFSSEGFRALLPEDWPLEERRLDEILHASVLA